MFGPNEILDFVRMIGTDREKYSEMLKELLGDILNQYKTIEVEVDGIKKKIEVEVTADEIIRAFIEFAAHGKKINRLRPNYMRQLSRMMLAIQDFESRPDTPHSAEYLKKKFRSRLLEAIPEISPFIPGTGASLDHLIRLQEQREKNRPDTKFSQYFPE